MCRSSETSARQLKAINQEDVRCVKEERKSPAGRNKTGPPAKPSVSHQVNEWFASLVQDNTLLLKKLSCMSKLMQELWLA